MTPVFADAFYFFALLNDKDAAHHSAKAFSAQSEAPYVTTAWVLTEVADGCASPDRRAAFLRLLDMLRESPDAKIVPASEELFERGIELFRQRADKDWPLTDCISFLVMKDEGLTDAVTGDRHFEQAGFRALLR
jgi:predicted nucleic acid-binding protein